jgi:hypothetical protein
MRMRFYRGPHGVKDVDRQTEYLLDNGFSIRIGTRNLSKAQFMGIHTASAWPFPKQKFKKLLSKGFIEKQKESGKTVYYRFTEKADGFTGEFK